MENGIIQLGQMKRDENYLCYFVTTPNREIYQEKGINKKVKIDVRKEFSPHEMGLEEMIAYLVRAGYVVRKGSEGGG